MSDAGVPPTALPGPALAGRAGAEEQRERAAAFAAGIRDWTECVAANAVASPDPAPDDFDPKVGCEQLAPALTPGGEPFVPGADEPGSGPPPGRPGGPPGGLPGSAGGPPTPGRGSPVDE